MTYVVEYVCMSSGWPHQSLSASDAPGWSYMLLSTVLVYHVSLGCTPKSLCERYVQPYMTKTAHQPDNTECKSLLAIVYSNQVDR